MRALLIGVAGVGLFGCCWLALGLAYIDQTCLWDSLPLISNVLHGLGYVAVCS